MQGRILGVKKSTILQSCFWVNCALWLFFTLFSIFFWKNYYLWFFIFCFFTGLQQLAKSVLFKLDSACYFGFLLSLTGGIGFVCYFVSLQYKFFYFLAAISLASVFTCLFTKQTLHLFFAVIVFVSGALGFLYCLDVLNLAVFLGIYLTFLFIFAVVCVILYARYIHRR